MLVLADVFACALTYIWTVNMGDMRPVNIVKVTNKPVKKKIMLRTLTASKANFATLFRQYWWTSQCSSNLTVLIFFLTPFDFYSKRLWKRRIILYRFNCMTSFMPALCTKKELRQVIIGFRVHFYKKFKTCTSLCQLWGPEYWTSPRVLVSSIMVVTTDFI